MSAAFVMPMAYHVDKSAVAEERTLVAHSSQPKPAARRRSIVEELNAESPRVDAAYQAVFPRTFGGDIGASKAAAMTAPGRWPVDNVSETKAREEK